MDDKVGEMVKKQNVTKYYRKSEVIESHVCQRGEGTRHIGEKEEWMPAQNRSKLPARTYIKKVAI